MNEMLFVFNHSEKVKYKGNPLSKFLFDRVQIIFWDSRKVKVLKMNEMHFVFSHSEKGNPCPNFLLKGGLDDNFFERRSR
jgi:hypothetical protein